MIRRASETMTTEPVTPRIKLALFRGCLAPSEALALDTDVITFQCLQSYGVTAQNIRSTGMGPKQLKRLGCQTAYEMRSLGFDALDLVNPPFCAAMIDAFGAEEVRKAFLVSAGDAVCIAGSPAMHQLDIKPAMLLEATAGSPTHAHAVLQQIQPRGAALFGCDAHVVLDTGLRASQLSGLGYFAKNLQDQLRATSDDLAKLGF